MSATQPAPQAPPHVFVTDKEARRTKRDQQQLAHVINRMLDRLGFPDKATRGVVGIHGALNGREWGKFPVLIAHEYMAQQLGFRAKAESTDNHVGRYLDAIKDA